MCGIVGIWDSQGQRAIDRDLLLRMNESQHHRGPDETGVHLAPGIGLGHKRLSIIDLATGQQRWASRLGGIIGGGVVVAGDTVFAATSRPEGKVSALDGKTGRHVWRTTTGPVNAPLSLIGNILVAENQKGEILGLDARTGDVRWRRRLGVSRIPAVPGDSGSLIVASVDSLCRINASDGKVVRRARSPGAVVSPWIRHGGLLVAGTTDSLVVGVDPDEITWVVIRPADTITTTATPPAMARPRGVATKRFSRSRTPPEGGGPSPQLLLATTRA